MTPPDAWNALRGLPVLPCADGGLINETFLVGEPPRAVLQRVNTAIFGVDVHEDMEAVTAHLQGKGLVTPRLLRTDSGELYARAEDGTVWRAMSFIPGRTVHRAGDPALAREAGALIGRFHAAVEDLVWDYRHVRPGAHDTVEHMRRLQAAREDHPGGDSAPHALAEQILEAWGAWEGRLDLPTRHAHGDLKISNLRFDEELRGRCVLDLETVGRFSLDVELGDAWRSWCNPVGEDHPETLFDVETFRAAAEGYFSAFRPSAEEREALVGGVERICLELSARFCRDAWEDRYFGWDARRFPDRRAHNLHRAQGQFHLSRSLRAQRAEAETILRQLAGG
jgi:Ser/Thr protein kinase RdoA (MazF antagonist)